MRENLNAIKRLVAFTLTVLLLGTTIWNDVFVIATEENHCSEYVDEQTYAARLLQPVGEGDGYCDYCGQVEQAHVHEVETEVEEEIVEDPQPVEELPEEEPVEDISVPEEPQPEIENTEETVFEDVEEITPEDTPVEIEEETPEEDIENPEEEIIEEETECEHEWTYTSNGDGTHVKKCVNCDEESTEDCSIGEDGKCVYCGYEQKEECEHEWEYISNNDGTHIKRCKKCGEEVTETCQLDENGICHDCLYEDERLMYQEFSKDIFGVRVKVAGMIPRGASVDIYYIGTKNIENIVNDNLEEGTFKAFAAYDITIYDRNGNKYQPEYDDNSVEVTFEGINEVDETPNEEIVVYRIEQDYSVTEIASEVVGDDVCFDAEHFTIYVTGAYSNLDYTTLFTDQDFAAVATASSAKAYTRVKRATFDLYVEDIEEYNFEVEVHRNLSSKDNPMYGNPISTGAITFTPTQTGWMTVEIDLNDVTSGDGYIAAGSLYSIVVKHSNNEVNIGYGKSGIGTSETYVKNSSNWINEVDNVLYLTTEKDTTTDIEATIEQTDTPDGDFAVESIIIDDSRAVLAQDGKYYIAQMSDSENGIAVKAELSNSSVERALAIKSGSNSIVSVTKTGPMTATIKAVGPGETTLHAILNEGEANENRQSITIVVLSFTINASPAIGDTPATSTPYTGAKITTETMPVKVYKDNTGTAISGNDVTVTLSDNESVGTAKASITYKVGTTKLTYARYFTITPIDIQATSSTDSKTAFDGAEYVISDNSISAVNNVNTNNALTVTPVYTKNDFTATLDGLSGANYRIVITGQGNFTGTVYVDYTPKEIDKVLKVELSASSRLKSCEYIAKNYTLTEVANGGWSELTFKNLNGSPITDIIYSGENGTADYAIYDYVEGYKASDYAANGKTQSPKTAGKKAIVITMKSGQQYTGSIATTFTIQKADMGSTTIVWTDGKGEFPHTGDPVEPKKGVDFKVYLDYVSSSEVGQEVSVDDYVVTYPVSHTSTSDNPYVKITGAGINFDSTTSQQKYYTIIANYELDLVVRIGDNGTTYDGTNKNNYVTGYTRYYDGTKTTPVPGGIPSLEVRLSSRLTFDTDYTYKVYDSYTNETTNTALSENVGTKYIVITPKAGSAYEGKKVIVASYEVIAKPITDADIANNITWGTNAKKKTFTGEDLTWTTAMSDSQMKKANTFTSNVATDWDILDIDSPDLTIKFGTEYLVEGKDYTINYGSNYRNAGVVSPTITGIGNYQASLSGGTYRYTISPASLTKPDTGSAEASAAIFGTPSLAYDGNPKCPDVQVTIGLTFTETYTYNAANLSSDNFTLKYENNTSPGTAKITITGKNNLTGSTVLTFTIGTNTARYQEIWIDNKYQAEFVSETPIIEGGKTVGYNRIYKCPTLETYYTGSKYNKTVKVIGKDGATLRRNTDYSYSYINATQVNTSLTYNESTDPHLYIRGINDYAKNNALVFFNIKPASISDASVEYTSALSYDAAATTAPLPTFTITLGTKKLVKDTDYTVTAYDTYDESTKQGTTGTKAAGEKYAVITGINNYTGTLAKKYTVGTAVKDAVVEFKNPFDEGEDYDSEGNLKAQDQRTYWKQNDVVRWEFGNAPNIYLKWSNGTAPESYFGKTSTTTAVSSSGSLIYEPTASITAEGMGLYDARAPKNDVETYNTITLTVTAAPDTQFYGSKEITYTIKAVDLDNDNTESYKVSYSGSKNVDYTGAPITPNLVATYKYGKNEGEKYTLDIDDDYKLDPALIPVTVGANGTQRIMIYGVGNFRGEEAATYSINPGVVKVYKKTVDDSDFVLVNTTTLETETYDLGTIYTFKKDTDQYPEIKVTSDAGIKADGSTDIPSTECTITYPSDKQSPGQKTIAIAITGANYKTKTITVTYKIETNSIQNCYGTVDDVVYTGNTITTSNIKANSIKLKLSKNSSVELVRGKDFELVTSEAELAAGIKEQYGIEYTKVVVTNSLPSYKSDIDSATGEYENFIFVKGIDAYSGYCKIPFSIVLDLEGSLANVTFPNNKYNLASEASDLVPTIKYKLTSNASTFDGVIPSQTTITTDSGSQDVNNYSISRTNAGKIGPDNGISVEGHYICKGTATEVKDELGETVCFLGNLGSETECPNIALTGSADGVYDYTGAAVIPIITGISGTRNVDYTVSYEYIDPDTNITSYPDAAISPGSYYLVIKGTADSSYYVNTSSTAHRLPFSVKYNLSGSNVTMKFVENGRNITERSYDGTGFSFENSAIITITLSNDTQETIYDKQSNIVKYVSITPSTPVTDMRTYTVTASPKQTSTVSGKIKANFTIKGVSLSDSGKFTLSGTNFTYIGSQIKPTVTGEVTIAGVKTTLREGTDFSVSYHNCTDVGNKTAYVKIKGLGVYESSEFELDEAKNGTDGRYSIEKLNLDTDTHVKVEVEDTVYSGTYLDLENIDEDKKVELKPGYAVYYVDDTKGIRNKLLEKKTGSTGDWEVDHWAYNTVAATKDDVKAPRLYVKAPTNSKNTTGAGVKYGTFTINQLDINNSNAVSISKNSHEYTGSEIDISEVIALSTSYVNDDGDTVKVPLTKASDFTSGGDAICDYTITVRSGDTNVTGTKVKEIGVYDIEIAGVNSCTGTITKKFTVKSRSLPDLWHYYYQTPNFVGSEPKYKKVDANTSYYEYLPTYVDAENNIRDYLKIVINDCPSFVEGTETKPEIELYDTMISSSIKLVEGEDYEVSLTNATSAGTAEWYRGAGVDATHAKPTATSPAITITGINKYEGSITLPYNIGTNLNNLGLQITYTWKSGKNYECLDTTTASTTTGWHYTYNGVKQVPLYATVKYGDKTLEEKKDYTITYENATTGIEETPIDAGYKFIVITGAGDYCGTIRQLYAIDKKRIEAKSAIDSTDPALVNTFSQEKPMIAKADGKKVLEFNVTGMTRLTTNVNSAKKYLYDTGMVTAGYDNFADWYYLVYTKENIEDIIKQSVIVKDCTLGAAGTTSAAITSDDIKISCTFNNNEDLTQAVSEFSSNNKLVKFSTIDISFTNVADDDGNYDATKPGNYYVPKGDYTYHIGFIIVKDEIDKNFDIQVINNGINGANYQYSGYVIEPELTIKNGAQELIKDQDYEFVFEKIKYEKDSEDGPANEYNDNVVPGKKTLTIKGINDYCGSAEFEYYIWGDLSDTSAYYEVSQNLYEPVDTSSHRVDYTGGTTDPEELCLMLPAKGDLPVDYKLKNKTHYIKGPEYGSNNDYFRSAWLKYIGQSDAYWSGEKKVTYNIEFNEDNITIEEIKDQPYTGYPILPEIKLSGAAKVSTVTYTVDGENVGTVAYVDGKAPSTYDKDFRSHFIEPAAIGVSVEYSLGDAVITEPKTTSYNIIPRSVEKCKVVYSKTNRYTGYQVKPGVSVFIISDDGMKTLVEGTHYTVTYGENIFANCSLTVTGNGNEISGSMTYHPTIKLGPPVNIKLKSDSTSITATWVHDIYTAGDMLELIKVDTGITVAKATVEGNVQAHTFTGLESVTNYIVRIRSYQNINGELKRSEPSEATTTTGISTAAFDVTNSSSGRVTITWDPDGDAVIYKIFRINPDGTEQKIAVYPASNGKYTNVIQGTGLGKEYTYYIVGYAIINNELTEISKSPQKTLTVN